MVHTYDSMCEMLDNIPPWFYPTGLAVWIKPHDDKTDFIQGNEIASLMWPDMEDTKGWLYVRTLEEKPDIPHREWFWSDMLEISDFFL